MAGNKNIAKVRASNDSRGIQYPSHLQCPGTLLRSISKAYYWGKEFQRYLIAQASSRHPVKLQQPVLAANSLGGDEERQMAQTSWHRLPQNAVFELSTSRADSKCHQIWPAPGE